MRKRIEKRFILAGVPGILLNDSILASVESFGENAKMSRSTSDQAARHPANKKGLKP